MLKAINKFLKKSWTKIIFLILGFGSLIWFLIRVVPKPSRAGYPCMKAAAPMASSFVLYLIGISGFTLLFRKAREKILKSKYLMASVFAVMGLAAGTVAIVSNNSSTWASDIQPRQTGNEPIGEGKGIFPGRVVWIHNPNATDKECKNSSGDYWYQDKNTSTTVVREMLSKGLRYMTGTSNDTNAWKALFTDFNNTHGRGNTGYTAGEKISIKVNMNNIWYSQKGTNTSPQIIYALLDQLVNKAGVAQGDISIGDPNCPMTDPTYDKCHPDFPDVIYWSKREKETTPEPTGKNVIFGSDGSFANKIPQRFVDATYLINVPILKKHHRAGISISSKNHFGSIGAYSGGAWHLHPSLPVPDANESGEKTNPYYGVYRCFVDIMGHKDLGAKTILFLVDGIWGSTNWGHPPIQWRMLPFNNDWPNSLFLSQDPVAIQSVCYDFLYEEFDENHPTEGLPATTNKGPFARFPGTDDFLHQAADVNNWPSGIDYDPENDGTVLSSLGAHEHWNNATDKQYSRNLGADKGIELITDTEVTSVTEHKNNIPEGFASNNAYPNPFTETTTITYYFGVPTTYRIQIFNTAGQLVFIENRHFLKNGEVKFIWDGTSNNGALLPKGQYIINMQATTDQENYIITNKIIFK